MTGRLGYHQSNNTRISAVYNRFLKRGGPQKANMAVARLMIRIIYVMLRDKVPYKELHIAAMQPLTE